MGVAAIGRPQEKCEKLQMFAKLRKNAVIVGKLRTAIPPNPGEATLSARGNAGMGFGQWFSSPRR